MLDLYEASLTPTTNIGASADGAEITTFFAPPYTTNTSVKFDEMTKMMPIALQPTFLWADAFSTVVKTPEDSTTNSAPKSPQGISAGFLLVKSNDFLVQKQKNVERQTRNLPEQYGSPVPLAANFNMLSIYF